MRSLTNCDRMVKTKPIRFAYSQQTTVNVYQQKVMIPCFIGSTISTQTGNIPPSLFFHNFAMLPAPCWTYVKDHGFPSGPGLFTLHVFVYLCVQSLVLPEGNVAMFEQCAPSFSCPHGHIQWSFLLRLIHVPLACAQSISVSCSLT